ncbi:F-box protein 7 [Musa acuminata AAA Group]|uniref:F-box protein 7 n=1 Tax=Musa acuminata AAA Group TaxID=214697 RepID=UPI0031E08D33
MSIPVPSELGPVSHLGTVQFIGTERPWLNLYGNRVLPVAPFGSISSKPFSDPALIHRCLPDELLLAKLGKLHIVRGRRVRDDLLTYQCIKSLYVSRNTYIRTGVADWEVTNPVHAFSSCSCGMAFFCSFLRLPNKSEVNDHGDYMLRIVEGWEENETHDPDVPAISHSRGLTPFVFVPFEEVLLLSIEGFIP